MKKIFFLATALAGLFLAASCQQENLEPVVTGNTVTYTVQVPESIQTKALGDEVATVNKVYYQVYRAAEVADLAKTYVYDGYADVNAGQASFELEFVKNQEFVVLFWAQNSALQMFDLDDLRAVELANPGNSNNANAQVFAGKDEVDNCVSAVGGNVELVRPISQLNIYTTKESLTWGTGITLEKSYVKVSGLYKAYNVAEGAAVLTAETETYEYALANVPATADADQYAYVAMNYVGFAANAGTNVTVDFTINTSEGDVPHTVANVPVKPNYRTNIVGNLLTAETEYNVTLVAGWNTPANEYEIWDGVTLSAPATNAAGEYVVGKPSEWAYLANTQNPSTRAVATTETVVTLTSDLDFGGHELTGLVAGRSKTLTVKGNGYCILNAKVVSGNNDNGTNASSLFISLPNSELAVTNLNVKNVNVVTAEPNGYAGVLCSYLEGIVNLENVNVYNSTVHSVQSIGAVIGFLPANGTATVKNCLVDGAVLTNADVDDESGAMGGFVGRVAGKLTAENVKVANTTIKAYVGTASDQKRSVGKFIGNVVGGAVINVTGAILDNVTLTAMNELAETQANLYTEYVGGWRGNGGTVSINGIEITKDNENLTVDTPAELSAALSAATDGAVIPVSGEITANALNAGNGKTITIIGMSEDAVIKSSARLHTSGNINFKNVTISLPTSNDYFGGHDAQGGTMTFDDCKFIGCVATMNGTITYNNCKFTNPDRYAAWVYSGNVTYNNCSFIGKDRAAKVYAEAGVAPVVVYNNCSFDALSVNKTAVEVDCSNQTTGTPYNVTIINPTINNMGVAEHYAVGDAGVCNLETSGKGLGIVNINGKSYSVAYNAAQLSALANSANNVTIEVAQDITENVSFTQQNGRDIVIDGNGKVMSGTINITARAATTDSGKLLIKDFNFVTTASAHKFINSSETNYYPNNVTISGCTFEGPGANSDVVPVTLKSANNFVMENCTATGVHSLLQNTAGWNITIRDCEVTNAGRGISLGTVQGALIENVKIAASAEKYGIRIDAGYNNNATIKNCEISAFCPVVVRKASVASTLTFEGTNAMTPANTDGLWCAIGTSEYETNGTMPTAATAPVTVVLNDTDLDAAGVYGAANL